MNLKILLSIMALLSISNAMNASNNQIHRLLIGTGDKMGEVMVNQGSHSKKLITLTPNDISIDTDPKVEPTIVGNMGDHKTYGKDLLSKKMNEKKIKEFNQIIFEHTPAVESQYVQQTIDKMEFLAFTPKVFDRREKSAGNDLNKYLKVFNGTYYDLLVADMLKKDGDLIILSRRYNDRKDPEVWGELCKDITVIAELTNTQNKKNLNEQKVNACNTRPQQTVEDYYKSVLGNKFYNIKIELLEDKEYVEESLNSGAKTNFKYIKVTAQKK